MRAPLVLSLAIAALPGAGCAGRSPDVAALNGPRDVEVADPNEPDVVREARLLFPRTIEMHQKIVARSCAPNTGVCHNTSNYPDLSTPGSMLQSVGAWCNLELPDPTQGYDPCERRGDLLLVQNVFISEIAWTERVAVNEWRIGTREPAPEAIVDGNVYFYEEVPDAPVLLPAAEWEVRVNADAGSSVLTVTVEGVAEQPFIETYVDEVLASLVGGDPNGNGVFGAELVPAAEEGARVLAPGDVARSYLWGRVTGTVPGTRMPLANQDLSDAEYVALACFIEGLPRDGSARADDVIDYDACAFAKAPVSHAIQ